MNDAPVAGTRLAIVTVNYKAAADTIACLASILAGSTVPHVVVVDNASGDGSVEAIAAWADAAPGLTFEVRDGSEPPRPLEATLTIVRSDRNGGFASGNNIGLRHARAGRGAELYWLLNNDTVVDAGAAAAVIAGFAAHPGWAMAGTQLRLFHQPDRFQLLNGMRFSRWTGAGAGIAAGQPVAEAFCADRVAAATDFVCGASLVMTRAMLETVGELEERFFLYYEEIDLALRAQAVGTIGFVPDAIVWHKEGASAGSSSLVTRQARSPLSDYHHIRSKMIFVRKHFPWLTPLYFAQNLAIIARRALRRQPEQLRAVTRATFGLPL